MLWGMLRNRSGAGMSKKSQTLAGAAQQILEIARQRRMPLAYIAEQNGAEQAQYWFANSMLGIVTIVGRRPDASQHENLTKDKRAGLSLDLDMAAIRVPDSEQPSFVDLSVPASQFQKYLEWVQTTK